MPVLKRARILMSVGFAVETGWHVLLAPENINLARPGICVLCVEQHHIPQFVDDMA